MTPGKGPPKGVSASFNAKTPVGIEYAAGSVASTIAVSRIERRSDVLKERARAHHKKFEDRWVAKEAIRIWQRHLKESAAHPSPRGVNRALMPEGILKAASHNVQARTNRRLALINTIKTRMGNAVVRNMAPPSPRQAFNEVAPKERPAPNQTLKR
jgi:hypothetical protein